MRYERDQNPIINFFEAIRIALITQYYGWKGFTIYRTQFVFYLLYGAVSPFVTFLFIYVIYNVSAGVPGWTFYQLLFLNILVGLVSSLVPYVSSPSGLMLSLRTGGFDVLLTRPYSAFNAIMANFSDTTSGINVIDYLILLAYVMAHLTFTLPGAGMFAVVFVLGTIAITLFLQTAVLFAYRSLRSSSVISNIFNLATGFTNQPLSLYGFTGTILLTLLVPIGFATYFPAELFIGKQGLSFFIPAVIALAVLIGMFYKLITRRLKGYESAMG